jgi:hypothetical protein
VWGMKKKKADGKEEREQEKEKERTQKKKSCTFLKNCCLINYFFTPFVLFFFVFNI